MNHNLAVPLVALGMLVMGACISDSNIARTYDREERLEDRRHAHDLELVDHLFAHAHRLVDHGFDRHEQVFAMFDEFAPTGFVPSTCRFESTPSGAEVWELDIFDEVHGPCEEHFELAPTVTL